MALSAIMIVRPSQINEFADKGSYGIACALATIPIAIIYGSVLQ